MSWSQQCADREREYVNTANNGEKRREKRKRDNAMQARKRVVASRDTWPPSSTSCTVNVNEKGVLRVCVCGRACGFYKLMCDLCMYYVPVFPPFHTYTGGQ